MSMKNSNDTIGTFWFVAQCLNQLRYRVPPAYRTVTNTRCRIGTVFSPDDGHIVALNMYRKATNILSKIVY